MKYAAKRTMLRKSGKTRRRRSMRRMASLPCRAARAADAKQIADADDDVHQPEAGDEAAHERIDRGEGEIGRTAKERIERPEVRPRRDEEEQPCLDAVESEEEGERHAAIVQNESGLGPKPQARRTKNQERRTDVSPDAPSNAHPHCASRRPSASNRSLSELTRCTIGSSLILCLKPNAAAQGESHP